jgi:chorismate-pyruvate lyase
MNVNHAPMEQYFTVRGYVPGGMIVNAKRESLDIESMPAFLRVLLITDGTVTKSLEAYYWERVLVDPLGQKEVAMPSDFRWAADFAGEPVLDRTVRLRGESSGTIYAYAHSLLRLRTLPEAVRKDLLAGKIGIGEVLRERGLETYREVLDIGRKFDESRAAVFAVAKCGEIVYRTYSVSVAGEPSMFITEEFPYRLYTR